MLNNTSSIPRTSHLIAVYAKTPAQVLADIDALPGQIVSGVLVASVEAVTYYEPFLVQTGKWRGCYCKLVGIEGREMPL